MEVYLPEIHNATTHMLPLPAEEHSKLLRNTLGTLVKLFYAFLWQVSPKSWNIIEHSLKTNSTIPVL